MQSSESKSVHWNLYFLKQALRLNRNDAKAYFNRGSLYILLKDYKKATEDLQQAAKLFSEQGNTVLNQQALRQLELIGDLQKP